VIDELAAGGDGVGRDPDGRVIFVPFTAPGDRVRVSVTASRSTYALGVVDELLEPGPARTDPVCAVFGSCGGCAWQHVEYDAQLDAKREIAVAALKRIGGLDVPTPLSITPSDPYRYRTRSRVQVSAGQVGYLRRRSNTLCPTWRCPVLAEELEESLTALAEDPPGSNGEWELASGRLGDSSEVSARSVAMAGASEPRLWLPVGEDRISFSPGVFVQSNAGLLEPLTRAVFEAAGEGELALDLFAGAGFLTLGLARRFESVLAIEANPAAVADLEANLQDAGLSSVQVVANAVETAIAVGVLDDVRPNTIVLDPPRTGLPNGVAEKLASLDAEKIVYLSCDPATLARDLSVLDHQGYRLKSVEGFDLFPQTPHLELLAVAERDFRGDL
jgi:23S rRNA (uracil1939-C5)-methyltransferase